MQKVIDEHVNNEVTEHWNISFKDVLEIMNPKAKLFLNFYKDLDEGLVFLDKEEIILKNRDNSDYWNAYDILTNRN